MRSFTAGLILFSVAVLSLASGASGQATGQVLGIGFDSYFRPDCWTPLRVQLHSDSNDVKTYMIQVHQQDLDKDTVVYTRRVVLNPKPAIADYFVYFVPQPANQGLPEADPRDLAEKLKVYLYDESGKTLIAALPLSPFNPSNIAPPLRQGYHNRGQKLIVAVKGDHDSPSWSEYRGALGLMEGVQFITLRVEDLPDNVLGYEAVDGIIWFDAQAREAAQGGSGAFNAMEQWVQQGGQLVVCQPGDEQDRGKIAAFADAGMLPVKMKDAEGNWLSDFKPAEKPDLQPLYDIAVNVNNAGRLPRMLNDRNWFRLKQSQQPFKMYRAQPKPGAVVDRWINWDGTADKPGSDNTPYIARQPYGMGSVTWVAQDLGSPRLTSIADPKKPTQPYFTGGWPYVWDKVFGWKNETIIQADYDRSQETGQPTDKIEHPEFTQDAPAIDAGNVLMKHLDASARGIGLVFVAIVFFIVYWIVAGPGSYLFLASRKRQGLSWTVFAVAALIATALTVLVVKLVLSGDPEVHHVTIVRLTPDAPAADGSPRFTASVTSRFGLYIPRDGEQTVELSDAGTSLPSYVIPMPMHPELMPESPGFTDTARYDVATDALTTGDVSVRFPYRSTLKKIQTQWNGTVAEGIMGAAKLVPMYPATDPNDRTKRLDAGPLTGMLTNATGRDLHDVYFAFRWGGSREDRTASFLYERSWPKGAQMDLTAEYQTAQIINAINGQTPDPEKLDAHGKPFKSLKGPRLLWYNFWVNGLEHPSLGEPSPILDDSAKHYLRSFPLMAFYEQIGPSKGQSPDWNREELFRRGGRGLNVSQLIAGGRLVIVAQADGAVPFPLKVNGSKIEGEGVSFYEISLPLEDRTEQDKIIPTPTTMPTTTQPATKPAGARVSVDAWDDIRLHRDDNLVESFVVEPKHRSFER